MDESHFLRQRVSVVLGWAMVTFLASFCSAQIGVGAEDNPSAVLLLQASGKVEILRGTRRFAAKPPMALQVGDRLETGPDSHATLRWYDRLEFQTRESSVLQVPPPKPNKKRSGIELLKGVFYFFHRDKPKELDLRSPTSQAVVLGTEFVVQVEADGRTVLSVLEGRVEMSNDLGQVELASGERGISEAGKAPVSEPIEARGQLVQWFLYYPAVLDVDELQLNLDPELLPSLRAYRSGDLEGGLRSYPQGRQAATEDETVFVAGLRLGAGQVEKAERLLDAVASTNRAAAALRTLIGAITGRDGGVVWVDVGSASGALAGSYAAQAGGDLAGALVLARKSVSRSIGFGAGWARLAELEFSFGRLQEARDGVAIALQLSPNHAEAMALDGFLWAAANRIDTALERFDRAIELNGRMGMAWLGRGLCRMKNGETEAGLRDLQTAATLEPQRSVLRSYLGKAFEEAGETASARRELELARELDPGDPTPWLYAALMNEEGNRLNEAVRDLETAQRLNDNRGVFRSRLLLDQDRAVRGANLARIYGDAGMEDVSVREASRAVNLDYGNYSAHLFLANSYNRLRDPNNVNLRFEAPWFSEYLLANLLAPVGAGILSQSVSQLEYSRLFERDRFGLVNETTYSSRGALVTAGAHYGIRGNMAYSVDGFYRTDPGQRNNNDIEAKSLSFQFKQQLTASDSVFLQGVYYEEESGDLTQFASPGFASPDRRVEQKQDPLLLAGYHHRWGPGVDTLFLAGRVAAEQQVRDSYQDLLLLRDDGTGTLTAAESYRPFDGSNDPLRYRSDSEIYTVEAQQIWWGSTHRFVVGGRYQAGTFEAGNDIDGHFFFVPNTSTDIEADFERVSAYGYYHWQAMEALQLSGGATFDYMEYPVNHRVPPVTPGQANTKRVSPKAGLIWTPGRGTTVRAAYTRSLGGVGLDGGYGLEPSQVAGFTQTYRSLIPESVAGEIAATRFETWGVAVEKTFATGTYFGVTAEWLESDAHRDQGVFLRSPFSPIATTTASTVAYRERNLTGTLNQLLGREWSVGARYRISEAKLDEVYTAIPASVSLFGGFATEAHLEATLRQLDLYAIYNHRCGFFSRFDALWSVQDNRGGVPDADFWQLNLYGGYRFAGRRAEVRLALLNLTDQDYRLNPLNLTRELPRERTFEVRVSWYF